MSKTDGGSYTPQLTKSQSALLAIVEDQVRPLENPFDSAAEYCGL